MTSSRHRDNENPVQLFPFVAVLLCTMGVLLVLLVTIASSSKARALEEAAELRAQAQAAAAVAAAESREEAEASRRELERVLAYQREIDAARRKADEVLQHDRARMAHLEDHMRRLREELESMKLAAAELNSLEDARFDDQEQAKREIERLQQLIDEKRKKIDELRAEANRRSKSYAIVPFQSQNGTRRRPVYIECRETEAVLQPEGVVFTRDDFRPPIGPGNPLVAALRAAREQLGRTELADAQGKAAVPYPLIIVRPSGVKTYYYVREAIQSWESEFGYELVEEDWELKYGAADPQLATVEYEAAEAARDRLRALAEAAPQAYGAYRFGNDDADDSWGGDFADGESDGGFGPGGGGGGGGNSGSAAIGGRGGSESGAGRPGGGRIAAVIVKRQDATGTDDAGANKAANGKSAGGGPNSAGPSLDNAAGQAANGDLSASGAVAQGPAFQGDSARRHSSQPGAAGAQGQPGRSSSPANHSNSHDPRSYASGRQAQDSSDRTARNATADEVDAAQPTSKQRTRGKNWAIRNANGSQIPIRRTIQIEVRGDALAILPEASSTKSAAAAGREFPFQSAPHAAYEDLLSAIDNRIEDWGMAGQGLYWRPVIELRVGVDGDRRVDELVRLLEHGGAEIRGESVARQAGGGANGATQ